jgi:integrase
LASSSKCKAVQISAKLRVALLQALSVFVGYQEGIKKKKGLRLLFLRRGEIFKLTDDALDFRQGFIVLRAPKGGRTVTIPMNGIAREILLEQLAWRDERFLGSAYVFPGRGGERRVDSGAADHIKAAAGLPKSFRVFHGLRHHFALTLANSGQFSLDMIGELLTHKGMAMTRRYGQFLPDTVKRASGAAAELLSGQAKPALMPGKVKEVVGIGGSK